MKVVINKCWGGYSLSQEAVLRYCELKGIKIYLVSDDDVDYEWMNYSRVPKEQRDSEKFDEQTFDPYRIERNDPVLVQVVEELGKKANGMYSSLSVVEIPDDVKWEIHEYDGQETIHECHRTWS